MTGREIAAFPVKTALEWARGLVSPVLQETVAELPEPERRLTGYHRGWCTADGGALPQDLSKIGGKAVRPALALLCAAAVQVPPREAVPAAVAVELVHDFSLLHDDVMDGDPLRRHRPAAWAEFGVSAAVLAGDALLVRAMSTLVAVPATVRCTAVSELSAALTRLLEGQSQDIAFERRPVVSTAEYLTMAEGKTGALMGCACALGAALGGADAERVAALRTFGSHLGVAFQCADDLLGVWGDSTRSGKPVGSDLRARKKSLPVLTALTGPEPERSELAAFYARREPLTEAELPVVAGMVERLGGRQHTEAEITRQRELALQGLDRASPEAGVRSQLAAVTDLMIHRDH